MKNRTVTMDDISRECGLSKMTVSRALNGRGSVSQQTKEKVLQASKRLNYELNSLARNFSSNQSGFIGIATSFDGLIGSHYFREVINGFQSVLRDTTYNYALFDTLQESFNDGSKLAKLYHQRKVDGLLIIAPHTDAHFLATLEHVGVPIVVIGESHAIDSICTVSSDDVRGIELLCEHMVSLGHRQIAFVGGPRNLSSAQRREEAFTSFCREHHLSLPPHFVQPGDYTMGSGRQAGLALLTAEVRPTAIIAANDLMAYGVIESARQLKLEIPQYISVVGFDDLPTAAERHPSLTTIHQPVVQMAQEGARILCEALKTKHLPHGHFRMEVSLVTRESSAKPRSAE